MDIASILPLIRPNEEWSLSGTEYEGLRWNAVTPKPTLEEIQAGESQLLAEEYKVKRAREYPPIPDQLEAIWKGGAAFEEMKARIMAIKAKYPKGK